MLALACLPGMAMAQSMDADPELEELIPDSAISDPESWAMDTEAANTPTTDDIDPASELDDDGFTLDWPEDSDFEVTIEDLEIDPELEGLLNWRDDPPARDLALPGMTERQDENESAQLVENKISGRITFNYPESFSEFSELDGFIARFEGLSDIKNLRDGDDNLAQVANRAKADSELLTEMLSVYGFYDAEVRQRVRTPPEGQGSGPDGGVMAKDATFVFTLDPGERYKYGAVELPGLEKTGDDYDALRADFEIQPGDYIQEDRIVTERIDLQIALGETGYPFVDLGAPELLIDHERDEGDLTLEVTSGGKYDFGNIVSGSPDFLSGKHLSEIARFDEGDSYKASDVDDLREAILATGLVSSLSIEPVETTAPTDGEPGTVDVAVEMTPAPLRTISGSLGYGTGQGFTATAAWEHRNFFPPEGMLRLRAIAGTQEQLAGATFRRNNWHGRDRVLTLDVFANTIDRDAYEARTVSAIGKFEKLSTLLFQKKLAWSIGLELVATQEREGTLDGEVGPRETYFVAALPGQVTLDYSDSLLDPTKGWRITGFISPETSHTNGNQSQYARSWIEGRYYQPVSDSLVIAGRAKFGTIQGTAIDNVAPSRRLYAGGGGSVRGYDYQGIGPQNDVGDPTGGRSLSEFSLEARYRTGLLDGAVSIVPFIDAGTVDTGTTPGVSNLQYGAGIGMRYHTNFGPLRVDLATPLNPRPGDSRIGVYIALGQSF